MVFGIPAWTSASAAPPASSLAVWSSEDAGRLLAAGMESRLAVLTSLRDPRSVGSTAKLCDGTGADWMRAETEGKEWDPCQETLELVSSLSSGTRREKEAGISRKHGLSAHLLPLYPGLTQSGIAWQDVFTAKPEWPISCRTNCRVRKNVL